MRSRVSFLLAVSLAAMWGSWQPLQAQRVGSVDEALYREVMPGAERFGPAEGDPPVMSAYRDDGAGGEVLHGYVFLTADIPPEPFGYSGPIEALVGMRTDGTLTGVRVVYYRESYRESMGDFLRRPGFQEQFTGKYIGDPFRVWDDVDGISRASISVRALARGVRDSARRVANAYGLAPDVEAIGGEDLDPVGLSWFELRQIGVVERFEVTEPGEGSAGIALALIENERLGEYFLGPLLYERGLQSVERRGGADNLVLYAIDGSRLRLFRREGWSVVQDGDTVAVDPGDVVSLGLPSGGVASGEATLVGLMLLDGPLDVARPFRFVYDLGELGTRTVEYVSRQAHLAVAEAEAEAEAARRAAEEAEARRVEEAVAAGTLDEGDEIEERATDSSEAAALAQPRTVVEPPAEVAGRTLGATDSAAAVTTDSAPPTATSGEQADPPLDFVVVEEETLLERTLASTQWGRVATMVLVLSLAVAAFVTKTTAVKWAALTVTLVVLGFVDGGFLSVSHITSGIWTGVDAYARDLPLLLMVVFTLVTTLVWGRIFCGFLCPFGALQDFIDRLVPDRLKWEPPQGIHDRAVWIKFGVLALVVIPPLLGSRTSVYQYVEPFGTVFFLSSSAILWAIAGAILVAAALVPRFYCRYACPLGAALAVLSVVSLRRIRRVPQCDVCKVCEQKCPTRAIRGPEIDFPECVRCNVCEVQLETKAGVCRHDMDEVRARLVNIELGPRPVGRSEAGSRSRG